jgi:hypothetical protein
VTAAKEKLRKAKKIPAGTPALKERHKRYFWDISPAFPGSRAENHPK